MDILCVTQRPDCWEALRPVFAAQGATLRLLPALGLSEAQADTFVERLRSLVE